MDWFHKVDPNWLAARKNYLCASDFIKLLPTTPTGRARPNMDGAYLSVWAEKQCGVAAENIISRGVMARGHILETYALHEVNVPGFLPDHLYHWDDAMVTRNGVSCSPDALDLKQPPIDKCVFAHVTVPATMVGEVKAYSAAAHYEAALTPKEKLMERWQLATAFYIMPTINLGALIFYNPSANHPLFIQQYSRADLTDELILIEEILTEYFKRAADFDESFDLSCITKSCRSEREIIEELEALREQCELNP